MTGAKNGYFAWVAGATNAFPAPSPSWGATLAEARETLLMRGCLYPGQRVEVSTWARAPVWVHQGSAEADAHEEACPNRCPHPPGSACEEARP